MDAGGVKLFEARDSVIRQNEVTSNVGAGLWCDTDCFRIEYADNFVANNTAIGIFHEISFDAAIHGNQLRQNGVADSEWFWGADIALAGSRNVRVTGNRIEVAPERCAIVLIDQNRPDERGGRYQTRNDVVAGNEMRFQARPCAGGVSDAKPGDENFGIIESGGNAFDRNVYYVPRAAPPGRFGWGRDVVGWDRWRALGLEPHGRLVLTDEPVR